MVSSFISRAKWSVTGLILAAYTGAISFVLKAGMAVM